MEFDQTSYDGYVNTTYAVMAGASIVSILVVLTKLKRCGSFYWAFQKFLIVAYLVIESVKYWLGPSPSGTGTITVWSAWT